MLLAMPVTFQRSRLNADANSGANVNANANVDADAMWMCVPPPKATLMPVPRRVLVTTQLHHAALPDE